MYQSAKFYISKTPVFSSSGFGDNRANSSMKQINTSVLIHATCFPTKRNTRNSEASISMNKWTCGSFDFADGNRRQLPYIKYPFPDAHRNRGGKSRYI
jgi:hypothetical protein